jgi:UPF0176 protein
MQLHNKINREVLKTRLMEETFQRKTISFYRYFYLETPQEFRDQIYQDWFELDCLGRIYVAREGINAQMSVPEHHFEAFLETLQKYEIFKDIPIKYAVEDDGKSFYKLTIKVRPKLVADGLNDGDFDVTNVGTHLSGVEFHRQMSEPDTVVVDMRNLYESEIGHFENAILPEADTFREELEMAVDLLKDKKDQKVLLYCTGGIRCEKASAYLKHHGFKDVNQLHGGVLEYVRQIKSEGLESKFLGKNFVFDARMAEDVNGQVLASCHQCGKPFDAHKNCANDACHLLFIQCPDCAAEYENCCSTECKEERALYIQNPNAKKPNMRQGRRYRKSLTMARRELQISEN